MMKQERPMPTANHKIVSRAEWTAARKELLAREKQFTHERDRLSEARRNLPWVRVAENYVFDRARGKATLAELFDGRSQLVIYHFMFDPEWKVGCTSCSFWADNFNGIVEHLKHRDVKLMAISRAPLAKLLAFQKRMGWSFDWASSFDNKFNHDYGVSFTREELASGAVNYNYGAYKDGASEMPGISVFTKDAEGNVFHTYSCYARGIDMMNGAYHYLDLVPKGRDEAGLSDTMAWLRRHDEYDT
jgi:predicted dithiol-disulfide oxidoreductase (DUF899 family)